MSGTGIVYLDTETTGLKRPWMMGGRRVWDVALIDQSSGKETQFFIDCDMADADPFALKIGNYYGRHPNGQILAGDHGVGGRTVDGTDGSVNNGSLLSEHQAAVVIAQITHGKHLMGAVGTFDEESFAHLLWEQGITPQWHYHVIEVEAMAVGWLQARQALEGTTADMVALRELTSLPWKSDDLARACGVEPPSDKDRHTAMGDARWVKRWHEALQGF